MTGKSRPFKATYRVRVSFKDKRLLSVQIPVELNEKTDQLVIGPIRRER